MQSYVVDISQSPALSWKEKPDLMGAIHRIDLNLLTDRVMEKMKSFDLPPPYDSIERTDAEAVAAMFLCVRETLEEMEASRG